MKILIFGKGFIGTRAAEAWSDAVLSNARIDDKAAVEAELELHKPDAVLNAAGKTGTPNVDWCETHQTETMRANVIGPLLLAEACAAKNIYLLHLGSGCIFYGPSPDPRGWREDDFANPESFYSRTKNAADLILSRLPNVGIARLRMPIDSTPSARNLIDKLSKYQQVIDVENSVTIIDDLLPVCHALMEKKAPGVFHVTNPGAMRHRHLLDLYRELVDPNHRCVWISDQELVSSGLALKKRSNCILQSNRLAEFGITMRPLEVALRDTMQKYADARRAIEEKARAASGISQMPNGSSFHFLKNNLSSHEMKGVILAGGSGTRLAPLTNITNKHLLPIFNQPMILYPLQTLLDAGIRDILLITGPDHANQFMKLLGSGAALGCSITYRIQDQAGGIAHALGMAKDFVGSSPCAVILGDNIFEENFLPHFSSFQSGAMTFYKAVQDPERFGVVEVDGQGNVLSIEEKPKQPKSAFAQVGLYLYEPSVFEVITTLKPSGRGELEIVDVNNHYLRERKLTARPIKSFWSDAGTFSSLRRANEHFANKSGVR